MAPACNTPISRPSPCVPVCCRYGADNNPHVLPAGLRAANNHPATEQQATKNGHIIGKMFFIGRMTAPVVLLHASVATSKIFNSQCHHLRVSTTVLQRLKTAKAEVTFLSTPRRRSQPLHLHIISDAAMAKAHDEKGQFAYLRCRRSGNIVHPIDWIAAIQEAYFNATLNAVH